MDDPSELPLVGSSSSELLDVEDAGVDLLAELRLPVPPDARVEVPPRWRIDVAIGCSAGWRRFGRPGQLEATLLSQQAGPQEPWAQQAGLRGAIAAGWAAGVAAAAGGASGTAVATGRAIGAAVLVDCSPWSGWRRDFRGAGMGLAGGRGGAGWPFTTLAKVRASRITSRTAAATVRLERMVGEDAMIVAIFRCSCHRGHSGVSAEWRPPAVDTPGLLAALSRVGPAASDAAAWPAAALLHMAEPTALPALQRAGSGWPHWETDQEERHVLRRHRAGEAERHGSPLPGSREHRNGRLDPRQQAAHRRLPVDTM
ncbi:hypothetical protein MRX96_006035 [Rhipicephalus microplus]